MCILKNFGLLSHSLKPRSELLQRSFLNPRNIRPRDTKLFRNLLLSHRSANRAVNIRYSITFADYLSLALVKFFDNKTIKSLRVDFQLGYLLDVDAARNYVFDCERVSLGIAFNRLADVQLCLLMFHLAEVHFYLIINNIVEETNSDAKRRFEFGIGESLVPENVLEKIHSLTSILDVLCHNALFNLPPQELNRLNACSRHKKCASKGAKI